VSLVKAVWSGPKTGETLVHMARIEYLNDPEAPKANSIVVAVSVFVVDELDRVLLIRRTDNGLWAIPGGAQEVGEYLKETAVRETREESGIQVEVTGVIGLYSNPNHVMAYTDGEVRQQFSICFRASYLSGEPTPSDESSQVRWTPRDELDGLQIHPSMRLRIDHGYANEVQPYIG
jgi:ADP-ribose pyrophosphatase YjhB (NUDIX family)